MSDHYGLSYLHSKRIDYVINTLYDQVFSWEKPQAPTAHPFVCQARAQLFSYETCWGSVDGVVSDLLPPAPFSHYFQTDQNLAAEESLLDLSGTKLQEAVSHNWSS